MTKSTTIINDIVEDLLKLNRWLTFEETEECYIFEGGLWQNHHGKTVVDDYTNGIFGKKVKQHYRNEVYHGIKSRTRIPYRRIESSFDTDLIHTVSGVVSIENGKVRHVEPTDYFFYVLPVRWVVGAECPEIDKFFHEIMHNPKDSKETLEKKVDTLYQIFGYCLLRAMPIHKMPIFVGEGSNGKSTLLKLLETFLGTENVSRESLHSLASSRFATIRLFGKLANICADIPATPIKYTGQIKNLTGNDPIQGEKKFVQETTNFTNYAKPIFSCNQIPIANDESKAWFRRQLILDFPNVFNEEYGNCDRHILEKLTTDQELAGLLQRAFQGLKTLLMTGKFAYDKTDAEWEEEYMNRSDSVKAFWKKKTEDNPNNRISKEILYQSYVNFCHERKLPPYDPRQFWTQSKIHAHFEQTHVRIGKKRVYCIDGIRLLDPNFVNENMPIIQTQTTLEES